MHEILDNSTVIQPLRCPRGGARLIPLLALSARLLKRFGSPDAIFRAPLTDLEACSLPAPVAQAVVKKEAFKCVEKELTATRNIDHCPCEKVLRACRRRRIETH